MWFFDCYNKKKSENRCTLHGINKSIFNLKQRIKILKQEKEERIIHTKKLYENNLLSESKFEFNVIKRIEESINRTYAQLNILELNRLSLIEEENSKTVFELLSTINKEHSKSGVKIKDAEKLFELNTDVIEERKETSGILEESFVESFEMEFVEMLDELKLVEKSDEKVDEIKKEKEVNKIEDENIMNLL